MAGCYHSLWGNTSQFPVPVPVLVSVPIMLFSYWELNNSLVQWSSLQVGRDCGYRLQRFSGRTLYPGPIISTCIRDPWGLILTESEPEELELQVCRNKTCWQHCPLLGIRCSRLRHSGQSKVWQMISIMYVYYVRIPTPTLAKDNLHCWLLTDAT